MTTITEQKLDELAKIMLSTSKLCADEVLEATKTFCADEGLEFSVDLYCQALSRADFLWRAAQIAAGVPGKYWRW